MVKRRKPKSKLNSFCESVDQYFGDDELASWFLSVVNVDGLRIEYVKVMLSKLAEQVKQDPNFDWHVDLESYHPYLKGIQLDGYSIGIDMKAERFWIADGNRYYNFLEKMVESHHPCNSQGTPWIASLNEIYFSDWHKTIPSYDPKTKSRRAA